MISIDRHKKSFSCIMAVFTMMSLRMNLLKMDYKGNPLKPVFGCTIRFFTRAAYSLCGNDMFILLYVKRNSEV